MTRQIISSGSAPIVWSTIDAAFDKINANFTDLYASVGDIGSIGLDALETDVSPAANGVYNVGHPGKRWKDVYVSGLISIGGAAITNEGLHIDLPSGSTVGGELIKNPAEYNFKTISVSGQGDVVSNSYQGVLNLSGSGIAITTNASTDTVTFTNSGILSISGTANQIGAATVSGVTTLTNLGVLSLTAGLGVTVSAATGSITLANSGIVTIEAGNGITVGSRDPVTGKVIITNSLPAGNTFRSFAVSGYPNATASNAADTATFAKGAGINITTDGSKTVTFINTGVTQITTGSNITATGSTGNITIGFDNRVDIIGSVFADNSSMLIDGTNGRIVGPVFANVTGDVTGNLIGNVTGDLKGSVFGDDSSVLIDGTNGTFRGNLTGNVTGFLTGDMKGSVFGDDSSKLVDAVESKIVGRVETTSVAASSYLQTAVYADALAIAAAIPTPTVGMIVFQTDTLKFVGWNGSAWSTFN